MKKETLVMTKRTVTLFILAIALIWTATLGPFQVLASEESASGLVEGVREAPEFVEIDAITSATTRYLPVLFGHREHSETYTIACKACHGDKPTGDLRTYYHRLCLGCHATKEGISSTPPDCFSCHVERQ